MIRVLLADDQLLFVESLKRLLEIEAQDITVEGIAHDGAEAVSMVETVQPDLALLDVRMPKVDGVEAVRRIRERGCTTDIIMLTVFDDDAYVHEALRYGARGYLLKDTPPDELVAAMYAVHKGGVTISPAIAGKLVKRPPPIGDDRARELLGRLTEREREILGLIVEGFDNVGIASELHLGLQTVKNYISTIYSKLDVHRRAQAIQVARLAGLA